MGYITKEAECGHNEGIDVDNDIADLRQIRRPRGSSRYINRKTSTYCIVWMR